LEERERLSKENATMKVKLSSAQEPKNIAKEVKKENKAGVKKEGNRGVLFKTKQPTPAPRITVEVITASSQK
jgi:hypothetical protein